MLAREPNEEKEDFTQFWIHKSWHCPWQFLEELKEKLEKLMEIQPYKWLKKVGKMWQRLLFDTRTFHKK